MKYRSRTCMRIRCVVTRCQVCWGSNPNFLLPFSLRCVRICVLGDSLPMLRRRRVASQEDASRPDAHPKPKGTDSKETLLKSTVQLMPGDIDWTKVNPFQGERKIDDQWDEADYEIARQVTNGSSSYEKQDSSGKLKVPHHIRFFLVATPHGAFTALCQNEYANVHPTTRSAPAEFTLKECDIDLPRNKREERQSQCSTSFSPCGQVDRVR